MVNWLSEVVSIPRPLLKELYGHFAKIEEILATLEELADNEGLRRIKRSLQEFKQKEYLAVENHEKIREALMKD